MIIRILIIFLFTFTTINTTPCKESPTCKCSSNKSNELNIVCDVDNSTGYSVNIKPRNNIQIVCKNWRTWENFYVKGRLSEKILQSLSFEECGLPNGSSLKGVAKQLGVTGTHTLIFKSFKNLFASLKRQHLQGFQSVKSLVLSDNGLFDISNDLLLDFPELEYIFRGLNKVRKLSIKNNKIETLPDKIFEDMEELGILDLSNNRMVCVSRNLFLGMPLLYELNIERNQLQVIHKEGLTPLANLRIAMFSHNPLKLSFVNGRLSVFYTNQYLEELYLSNSSIYYFFDDWLIGNNNLRLLDLSHNSITNVTIEEMLAWRWEKRNIVIDLKHNPLLCDCPLYDLLRYHERKMSNLVYNYYKIIMGNLTCVQPDGTNEIEISNLNSSTYVCLEHEYFKTEKKCQNDCTCSVRPSDKTRILDCSYKNMSEFLIDETRVIFQRDNPIILNLTGNFLTEIPSTELLYPINVTGLLLSNNKISSVTLDKLPYSLKILELHNNHISTIYFDEVNALMSISLEKFTLSGNPIICDCNNQNLLNFVQSHRVYYEDLDNLTCMDLLMHQIHIENLCPSYSLVSRNFWLSAVKVIT
ncbi:toll-like receptor Tollo [Polistes fuscatus]|uniref:toll-like receptor Tollo n=1 Tax=Polistes fuscatus TaxID=30207 RepID=UPI001CA9E35C|nr:toll-like receptor Tollo [Polistes fuscatus]